MSDDDELVPVATGAPDGQTPYRAGFACLVGRPNAGKSTLTNALVGDKVAITSSKPQTTRHTIRGIVTGERSQLVLVDTPGLHKPRTLLGRRLNDLVRETLLGVDVIGFCLPADQKVGPGDSFIAAELAELVQAKRVPVVAIVTKTDAVDRDRLVEQLIAVDRLGDWAGIVPCSARRGDQVEVVRDLLVEHLPASPGPLYPQDVLTDEPTETMIAELVREAALEGSGTSCRTRSPSSSTRSSRVRGGRRTTSSSTSGSTSSSNATARRRSSSGGAGPGCARSARPLERASRRCSDPVSSSTST